MRNTELFRSTGRAPLRRALLGLLALLYLAHGTAVAAAPPTIQEYTLDNGLKLIVRPDHRAPVVVSQVWYKVGSSYEHPGITGISHVLEHMMFQGTENYAPGEMSRIVSRAGGRENAFTSRDYTGYYQMWAADRLPLSFELEAERMRKLVLSKEEFEREVQVVMEERRLRTEDNPIALGMERFNFVAYPASPYRMPVIGWWEDLRAMTVADLQAWYDRYYAPNNAVVVVVGDVEPTDVLALAEKHFGPLQAEPPPPAKPPVALDAIGERRLELQLPAEVPFLAIGYEVPSLATTDEPWKAYALEVLAGVLSGGESALLPSELVRGREMAASVSASYSLATRLDSQFIFAGYPAQGHNLDELETALTDMVARLQESLVEPERLERVKTQIVADHLYQMDSVYYQAMQIGILETTGIGWQMLENYEQAIQQVSAEQLREVARHYLQPARRTVMHLNPLTQRGAEQ